MSMDAQDNVADETIELNEPADAPAITYRFDSDDAPAAPASSTSPSRPSHHISDVTYSCSRPRRDYVGVRFRVQRRPTASAAGNSPGEVTTAVASVGASVALRDLVKSYRTAAGVTVPALAGVSLNIEPGEVVAVTAPSGAGKSTLLHVLGAMDAPDAGTIKVDGVVITALSRKEQVHYRQTVGFVFQRFHLLPALDALDNVVAPVMPYRTSFDKAARGSELLAAVGLRDRLDAFPAQLSGGQQQRVAIARSLINEPRLLLADEPTGNLDSATGRDIIDLLLRLNTDRGMTVVLATHDPAVAARCGRTLRLLDGRLVDE